MTNFGGQPLSKIFKERQLEISECLVIAVSLASILIDLNRVGIIHKDIKPSNIVINVETGQVKLTNFGFSSRLDLEKQTISNPNLLEGTLAYMAPEQTGRMNRSIDYRSDFYSLGVTLYEMLTQKLPFTSHDPIELVHCHIAKQPVPPQELVDIPQPVSDIVMKLLAKNAEERYQSAAGLKFDLETCLLQLESTGEIKNFPLGQRDRGSQLSIPQKLYGREQEVAVLMNAFSRVSQGATEMMLVTGYSGIGKTSIVNEVHKPIVGARGYFITGKFDQLRRDIPYAALIQAFQELISQLLTENERQIAIWKNKLLQALGSNGQVIIDVIPEVELIIGSQANVPKLGAVESENRFNCVFQQFLNVFCQPEHPLVMFLDDLQWADSASLKLLRLLIADNSSHYLFIIGAKGSIITSEVVVCQPVLEETSEQLPNSLINYVARTREDVILNDATREGLFTTDKYIIQNQPLSVLCTPIINQSELFGVLYLENNLAVGAFTSQRLEVLKILSSQAAISIKNAQLYQSRQQEICERQQAEEALRESEKRLAQFLEALPIGIFTIDSQGQPCYANQTAQKILGKGIVPGTTSQLSEVYQAYIQGAEKYYPDDQAPIIRALNGESTAIDDVELHLADKITPLEVKATPIFDKQGNIIYAIAAFQDITQRKQAEAELALKNTALQEVTDELAKYNRNLEQKVQERTKELSQTLEVLKATESKLVKANQELQRLSRIDKLTQVANRFCFDEYLLQEWNRLELEQQPLSLIICDVDYFKKYNDFYGHQCGDNCLQKVAQTLLFVVKSPTHLVARYGGEEFAVIMPSTDVEESIVVAEQIQQAIHQSKLPHACSDISQFITISLGISTMIPTGATSPANLIAVADKALYEAKRLGRARYVHSF